MPDSPNKLSKFWQELKRRKVIHVITVYASAAFIIIELAGNLTEPLNLPTSLSTIVIIVLAVCFLPAIILSWLYDLTSGTFERTRPMEEIQEEEKAKVPNAWKFATYVSFLVIAGLVVFNIVSRGDVLKPGMIQSLAILPFDNFTGDEKLDYVAAGMHTALIGDMGKLGALRVTGKNTSSIFKDSGKSAPDIARELDVEALVEPAVMYYGDSIIIKIRLITFYPREKQLFVEDYMVDKSQVLNLFSKISRQIADEIMIELSPEEERLFAKSITVDKEAYDAYLKGQYYWERLHPDSLLLAMEFFELAIQKEPEWAEPYVGLANTWGMLGSLGALPISITTPNVVRNLKKAMELDPQSAQAHYGNAMYAVWKWDWELGEKEFKKTIEINPNDALTRLNYARLLTILHRYDEAVQQADIGLALDPLRPLVLTLYSMALTAVGDYQKAIDVYETNRDLGSYLASAEGALEALYLSSDYEGWIQNWEIKVRSLWNDTAIENVVNTFHEKGHIAAIEEMFKMNEKYGNVVPGGALLANELKARRSLYLNKPEDALDYLEEMFNWDSTRLFLANIVSDTYVYEKLKSYPRYVELLRKMNLPLPKD